MNNRRSDWQQRNWQQRKGKKRPLRSILRRMLRPSAQRWLCWLLLLVVTAVLCVLMTPVLATGGNAQEEIALSSPRIVQEQEQRYVAEISPSGAVEWVQQARRDYAAGQYAAAVDLLQRALQAYQRQDDGLHQGLVLNKLALAYQQLGMLSAAQKSIDSSLEILQAESLRNTRAGNELLAEVEDIQGHLLFAQGQIESARQRWQNAEEKYVQSANETAAALVRINRVQALQVLGFHREALELLEQVEETFEQRPPSRSKAAGLRVLGEMLRLVGQLDRSHQVLSKSLTVARSIKSAAEISAAQIGLGNTARDRGQTEEALQFYQQAAMAAPSVTLKLQAQLPQLRLLVETGREQEAQALGSKIRSQVDTLPLGRTTVQSRIHLAESLIRLAEGTKQAEGRGQRAEGDDLGSFARVSAHSSLFLQDIERILTVAVEQAQELKDSRSQSYALGTLGRLYEQAEIFPQARQQTERALNLAAAIQAPDITYRWQWQLGRLLKAEGNQQQAIAAYQAALQTLEPVRRNLFALNSELQFSFQTNVEPLYRQLIALLLDTQTSGQDNTGMMFEQALTALDSLRQAELENFLKCNLFPSAPIDRVVEEGDRKAAFIAPIILEHRLELLYKLPGEAAVRRASTSNRHVPQQPELETTVAQLQRNLKDPKLTKKVREDGQKLYKWLIEPLEADLEPLRQSGQIETLVFVLDGVLRNIPMAVLYNQGHYLVEQYAIAVVPSRQLLNPLPRQRKLKALLAGTSKTQTVDQKNHSALPEVESELEDIRTLLPSSPAPLLNENFTAARLEEKIATGNFPLVHIATHGEFSSDPTQTFILAWGERIQIQELDRMLQDRGIELLILSACKTAQGNQRAALGLAGVAAKSTRSIVATLWQVEDKTTAELMVKFYKELLQGKSLARALQQAELSLLYQDRTNRPHSWAPFVLVGNWL